MGLAPQFLLMCVLLLFAVPALFQWLWNITMPETFGLKRIRYWIAFRLLIIAALLTSGGFVHFNYH